LLIGDCLLAEVPRAQLEHEWQVSSTISDADAATYCHRAAGGCHALSTVALQPQTCLTWWRTRLCCSC
jgi:hypothetical protein